MSYVDIYLALTGDERDEILLGINDAIGRVAPSDTVQADPLPIMHFKGVSTTFIQSVSDDLKQVGLTLHEDATRPRLKTPAILFSLLKKEYWTDDPRMAFLAHYEKHSDEAELFDSTLRDAPLKLIRGMHAGLRTRVERT